MRIGVDWAGRAHVIIENLIADKKIEPMIVVFPNGNATTEAGAVARDAVVVEDPAGSEAAMPRK